MLDFASRCWLILSATSPLVAVLTSWSLITLFSYRRKWRSLDLFLTAIFAEELVNALVIFAYSVLNLTRPQLASPCTLVVWAVYTIRTLQIATVTSMVVDCVLTIRWPYRYRFSVRQHHVIYHIAVLTVLAIFVGIASVFARIADEPVLAPTTDQVERYHEEQLLSTDRFSNSAMPTSATELSPSEAPSAVEMEASEYEPWHYLGPYCYQLPLRLERRFAIFIVLLHGLLTAVTIFCIIDVQMHVCCGISCCSTYEGRIRDSVASSSDARSSLPTLTDNRRLSWGSSCGSTFRHKSPLDRRTSYEIRWLAVSTIAFTSCLLNHWPHLTLTMLARFAPWYSPPIFLENLSTILSLAEGLLLPIVLLSTDRLYRIAFAKTFRQTSNTPDTKGKPNEKFFICPSVDGLSSANAAVVGFLTAYSETTGSGTKLSSVLSSSLPTLETSSAYSAGAAALRSSANHEVEGTLDRRVQHNSRQNGAIQNWRAQVRGALGYLPADGLLEGNFGVKSSPQNGAFPPPRYSPPRLEPMYYNPTDRNHLKGDPTLSFFDKSDKKKFCEEEHIYASLTDNNYGTMCSTVTEANFLNLSPHKKLEDDSDDCASVTTSANDDFEFHDTRACSFEKLNSHSSNESGKESSELNDGFVDARHSFRMHSEFGGFRYIDMKAHEQQVTKNNLMNFVPANDSVSRKKTGDTEDPYGRKFGTRMISFGGGSDSFTALKLENEYTGEEKAKHKAGLKKSSSKLSLGSAEESNNKSQYRMDQRKNAANRSALKIRKISNAKKNSYINPPTRWNSIGNVYVSDRSADIHKSSVRPVQRSVVKAPSFLENGKKAGRTSRASPHKNVYRDDKTISNTLQRKKKAASMNDLDQLCDDRRAGQDSEEDVVFYLSGRSESTFSLYRLNVDADGNTIESSAASSSGASSSNVGSQGGREKRYRQAKATRRPSKQRKMTQDVIHKAASSSSLNKANDPGNNVLNRPLPPIPISLNESLGSRPVKWHYVRNPVLRGKMHKILALQQGQTNHSKWQPKHRPNPYVFPGNESLWKYSGLSCPNGLDKCGENPYLPCAVQPYVDVGSPSQHYKVMDAVSCYDNSGHPMCPGNVVYTKVGILDYRRVFVSDYL